MSTLTANGHAFAHDARGRGVFRRALDRIVAHREQQAERAIAGYLLDLDDDSLAVLGHDRARLETLAKAPRPLI